MGGGGHANNPTFMFQVRRALNKKPFSKRLLLLLLWGSSSHSPDCILPRYRLLTLARSPARSACRAVRLPEKQVEGRRLRRLSRLLWHVGAVEVHLLRAEEGGRVVSRGCDEPSDGLARPPSRAHASPSGGVRRQHPIWSEAAATRPTEHMDVLRRLAGPTTSGVRLPVLEASSRSLGLCAALRRAVIV